MPQTKVPQTKVPQESVDLTKTDSEERGVSQEILTILKSFRSEFRSEILELKNDSKKYNKKLVEIDDKIKIVCDNHNVLDKKMDGLNFQVNYLQQKEFKNDLLITGLPSATDEPLIDTVLKYLKKLDKNTNNQNIEYVYRFKSHKQNNSVPVVVRFTTYTIKKQLLMKQKELGPVINQNEDGNSSNAVVRKIYCQQRLTSSNFQLLQKARDIKKKIGFKFVWVSDSFNIFIQKEEKGEAIKIVSLKQLDDFKLAQNTAT